MFENVNGAQGPQGVEDIFAGADAQASPGFTPEPTSPRPPSVSPLTPAAPRVSVSPLTPVSPSFTPNVPVLPQAEPPRRNLRWVVVAGIVVGVGALAAGYWWWATKGTSAPDTTLTTETPQAPAQQQTTTPEQPAATTPATPGVDSDGDGLDDSQEQTLGTDATNADTDADGLFDGEEVNIYHSNPTQADSDGDGYPDGVEVHNGYNPIGPGKLLTLPGA